MTSSGAYTQGLVGKHSYAEYTGKSYREIVGQTVSPKTVPQVQYLPRPMGRTIVRSGPRAEDELAMGEVERALTVPVAGYCVYQRRR